MLPFVVGLGMLRAASMLGLILLILILLAVSGRL
jgi:hypothetical protein